MMLSLKLLGSIQLWRCFRVTDWLTFLIKEGSRSLPPFLTGTKRHGHKAHFLFVLFHV